jgi:APA family basic amino acid/polyamine antiporter
VAVSLAVFLSAAGFVNAVIMQMPRSFHAMALDGVVPRAFMHLNPRTQVHETGLLFFGATMLVPAFLLGSFEMLLNYVIFTDMLSIALVASTVFVLRSRHIGDGAFAVPGYPLLPGIYLICLLCVAASVLLMQPRLAIAGIIILLAGWPLFHLGRSLNRYKQAI